MPRASKLLAVTTIAALGAAGWLFVDNRALHRELASHPVGAADVAARASDP